MNRRHFADEQLRNRRQSRRFSVIALPAVVAAALPLCIIVSPLIFALSARPLSGQNEWRLVPLSRMRFPLT